MTTLRRDRGAVSNYFDSLFRDIGHRGSSFTDVDGLVHDGATGRFLFLEFKDSDEAAMSRGQGRALVALSQLTNCETWVLRRRQEGLALAVCQSGSVVFRDVISEEAARQTFGSWWAGQTVFPLPLPSIAACCGDPEWHCRSCGNHLAGLYAACVSCGAIP